VLLGALVLDAAAEGGTNGFLILDSKRLDRLVQKVGIPGSELVGISRNGPGTELLLTLRTNLGTYGGVPFLLAIVSEEIQVKTIPGETAEVDEHGRPICLYSNSSAGRFFVFPRGEKLPHLPGAVIRFSPDASIFFLTSLGPTNGAPLFRAADPLQPFFFLPEWFIPQSVFVRTNEIFVFGQRARPNARPGDRSKCWGVVLLSGQGKGVGLVGEIDLSRFGSVLDMDPKGSTLLVDSKRDTLRTWGLYDLASRRYESLGLMRARGFFLEPEFASRLKGLLGPK
jgi:hypothetical protein